MINKPEGWWFDFSCVLINAECPFTRHWLRLVLSWDQFSRWNVNLNCIPCVRQTGTLMTVVSFSVCWITRKKTGLKQHIHCDVGHICLLVSDLSLYKLYFPTDMHKTLKIVTYVPISSRHQEGLQRPHFRFIYSGHSAGHHSSQAELSSLCGPSACFLRYFHNNSPHLGPETDRKLGHLSVSVLLLRGDITPSGHFC